jgi:hypothetical protein
LSAGEAFKQSRLFYCIVFVFCRLYPSSPPATMEPEFNDPVLAKTSPNARFQ